MGIQRNGSRYRQQRSTTQPRCQLKFGNNNTTNRKLRSKQRGNWNINELFRLVGYGQRRKLYNINSGSSISILPDISRTRYDESNNNSKNDNNRKRNRYNKRLYTIGKRLCLVLALNANAIPAYAESVGGVSATANPIANSSGSVTNQAIQVLQGPYITNTYGNQISCQGPTANFTPYIQYSNSWKDPFERTYMQPQYNNNDFTGRTQTQTITVKNYPWYDGYARGPNNANGTMGDYLLDSDGNKIPIEENWYNNSIKEDSSGNPILDDDGNVQRYYEDGADMPVEIEVDGPDGVPDNPGQVVWEKPVRTDMSANNNFNIGLSATLSLPLDKKLQRLCKQAATTQIDMQKQLVANKRLDFEIARLKNCGELMKAGIMFHPRSPYASICADVIVTTPPGNLVPHNHQLPRPKFENSSQPSSSQPPASSPPSSSSDDSSQKVSDSNLSSSDIHSSSTLPESDGKGFFRGLRLPWSKPSLSQDETPSAADQLGVWQVGHSLQQPTQSQPSSSQPED